MCGSGHNHVCGMQLQQLELITLGYSHGRRHVWKPICLHCMAQHLLYVLPILRQVLYPDFRGHRGQVQAVKGRTKVVHVRRRPALWVSR